MREIKLRAWDKEENRYWSQKEMDEIGGYYYSFGVSDYMGRFVLQQYTGLKDKNGREIYEGDIIVCERYEDGNPLLIFWDNECTGFAPFNCSDFINNEFQAIGNIYENPGLLK